MKNIMQNNQTGFTLIEILLYLSLSVVMVSLIGGIGVNVLSGMASAKVEEELQYNAQFVTEKIRATVSEAESIDSPSAGATSSVLSLTMSDPKKTPTVIDVFGGSVRLQQGEGEAQILSGNGILVSDIEFSNVTSLVGAGSVRVVLPMELVNPNNRTVLRASSTLRTTINLQYP